MTLAPVDAGAVDVFNPLPRRADTDSWIEVVDHVARLAQQIAGTEFVPRGLRNSVPATAAAMLYGREVGLPPMTALTQIHVIEGRPGMSAEGMRALVLAAGHELVFDESTGAVCRMRARRARSDHWTPLAWSIDMARAAGLVNKDNWKHHPRAMLVARCSGDLCRMVFPDVIHGFRTVEELADFDPDVEVEPTATSSTKVRRNVVQRRQTPTTGAPVEPSHRPADAPPTSTTPTPPPPLPGEETPEEKAPPTPVTAPVTDPEPEPPAGGAARRDPGPRLVNRATLRMIFRELRRLEVPETDRDRRLRILEGMVGRGLTSSNDLTQSEATKVATMLSSASDLDALHTLVTVAGTLKPEEVTVEPAEPAQDAADPTPGTQDAGGEVGK
jgi:hypothetical protein